MTDPHGPDGEPEQLSPIDPYALLEHARKRANAPGAEETDYRRAISDAFYALYHALTLAAAPHMTASDDPFEPYRRVRGIRHWHVRRVAEEARADAGGQVRMVAATMLRLYTRREDADYSHLVQFTRKDAEAAINLATQAVAVVTAPSFGGQAFPRQLAELPGAP